MVKQAHLPDKLPRHIAIVMDGNGRWAQQRHLPRLAGHRAGLETVRKTVEICGQKGIEVLTLFAFSSENWRRPPQEVNQLMDLLLTASRNEVKKLHEHNIQLRFVGDFSRLSEKLCASIAAAEQLTANNTGLKLVIAVGYGGRWDIVQAARHIANDVLEGKLIPSMINEETFAKYVCLQHLPEPDLLIRTSGEQRISNFLLWQLAYTELYFTDILWPEFNATAFEDALHYYATRKRRFGYTNEQMEEVMDRA